MKTTLNTHARLRRDLARVSDLADATADLTDAIEHLADAIENMPTATSVQEHQIDTLIHTVQLAIAGRSSSVSIGNSNSI